MTFRQILILTWLVCVPAVISFLVAFFLPEHIGTWYSAKGLLLMYSTLCFCFLAWSDFRFYMKRLSSSEKTGISLFAGFFIIFSGYALISSGTALRSLLKGTSLDQSFFDLNFFLCILLLVCWFLMRLVFDKKTVTETEEK